ncbi:uncharacterized protein [Physcomitrium patens]|uniref:RING-type domain-containing protein n=2 Tax=Physcomitrium patens TaxID=3218 RepID=A0A7I4C229_PHYPA|nr:uncharacterized protein LOC112287057 isoform X1 [Physcomitrium patens]|eukprot:XP_024385448.1 uncharacterized protein LOC112287057 isoform X1 [Physcomitrella patens]
MAASNSLSNGRAVHRRNGFGAGGASQNHKAMSLFQCQPEYHQDCARLYSNDNCGDVKQFRGNFMNSKDASRRKRGNRSPKLKQCKLDARREQWLSQCSQERQGKAGKQQQNDLSHYRNCVHHPKAEDGECMAQERACPSGHSRSQSLGSIGSVSERTLTGSLVTHSRTSIIGLINEVKDLKEVPARRNGVSCRSSQHFGDEELDEGIGHKQSLKYRRSSSDASKLRSNSSCASNSCTGSDSEDNDESHDVNDAWESAFDALHIQSSLYRSEGSHKCPGSDRTLRSEGKEQHDRKQNGAYHYHTQHGQSKHEYKYKNSSLGSRRGNGGRAWRSDDVSRPPTLPTLAERHKHPTHANNHHQGWGNGNKWGNRPASPSYCPICTEELDMTDSSYMPCPCGFQLCLFCYHRIASDDGRCPGCRKAYNTDVAVQVSRSSAVWLHV